jgi:hypothetical protein
MSDNRLRDFDTHRVPITFGNSYLLGLSREVSEGDKVH